MNWYNKLAGVAYARWLDWAHLREIDGSLPGDAELVVGIGGGTALDASKYITLTRELPLVLVPTVVSSGAIIHGTCARREGHKTIGPSESWPWIDPERVLVDSDVVLAAPHYLNTAGLGDVLCGYAGIAEWRRSARLGTGPTFGESAAALALQHHRDIITGFPTTLTTEGDLSADSVHFIMTAVQERDARALRHPAAPGSDHTLWLGMEQVNNKGWVHGEAVAMCAVVVAWHCGEDPEALIARLDACKVRWRPTEIGVSREELRKGLEFAPTFLSDKANGRDVPSVLRHKPLVGATFEALWEFLQAS